MAGAAVAVVAGEQRAVVVGEGGVTGAAAVAVAAAVVGLCEAVEAAPAETKIETQTSSWAPQTPS